MAPPTLTRYLYFHDEVLLALMICMLQKAPLEEVMFWLGEAYYTRPHEVLITHLWKIYYDFYAIRYPKCEGKIVKEFNKWQTQGQSMQHFAYIVNMLYHCAPCSTVFYLRTLAPTRPRTVYIGKPPNWTLSLQLDQQDLNLCRAIRKRHPINIAFQLQKLSVDPERCYSVIKKYFSEVENISLRDKILNSVPYTNKAHVLLAVVCHLMEEPSNIQKHPIFKRMDPILPDWARGIDLIAPSTKPRRILPQGRKYHIPSLVGCFSLARNNLQTLEPTLTPERLLWYHWEYFAYSAPIWKDRFEQVGAVRDPLGLTLTFPNDDLEEEFYERYGYEPDEQSKEVQLRSLGELDRCQYDISDFLREIFGETPIRTLIPQSY